MRDLSSIVKAYDIRGIVPDQLGPDLAARFGAAFVQATGAGAIVVGRDMRPSSPELSKAFAAGASGAVRAKTGLLDGVTSLSGLAELADGRLACFSLLVNGFRQGTPAAQKAVDGFVEALVR